MSAVTLRSVIESIRGALDAFATSPFGWVIDIADVLILAYLFYQLALMIRGTRAVQMMSGVIFVLASYWLAGLLQLATLQRFLGYLLYWIPFAIIVIFQNTIRRMLSQFGRNPFSTRVQAGHSEEIVNEVVLAATTLASRRIGGIIVIERDQGLRGYTETGIRLDAVVSYDVLLAIFQPGSPLHDGAVVIREGRIKAASCFLPLSASSQLSKEFGSRHRAAIGISEETDAVCVVASEERGTVSLAFEGRLLKEIDPGTLRAFLREKLALQPVPIEAPAKSAEPAPRPAHEQRPASP